MRFTPLDGFSSWNTSIKTTMLTATVVALWLLSQSAVFSQRPTGADPDLTRPSSDWVTNGGDTYNTRYSPLGQITTENVHNLKGEWELHLGGSGAGFRNSGEAQPIVVDGVAYISTGDSDIFAIDIESGEFLWQYHANLNQEDVTACCGWVSRGVAIDDDHVYHGNLDNTLIALDRRTGDVVWEVQTEPTRQGFSITHAPLLYDGLLYVGYAGGETGIRGRIRAFDATDGSAVWTFDTVPGPGELGYDTWPQDSDAYRRGGAAIWQTPALDPELGMLYFSTSNAAPGLNGGIRPGHNLFSSSIIALDIKTGAYRWHFQEVHHDIWDYDASNPVILFDAEYDGRLRKGLAQAGKTGWVYILDRETGEPLVGIEERPVPQEPRMATAATQPYPLGDAFVPQSRDIAPEGYTLVNKARVFTPYFTEPVLVAPGLGGGANWPPSALDVASNTMFICAADRPSAYQSGGFGVPASPLHGMGVLAAMDLQTNRLVWQQHWNEACYSGVTATAGGLVFVGRNDGRLTALAMEDGRKLWEFQTGAGMNAPVTVFEHDGTEYVIAYAAGNLLGSSEHGDSIWLFSLDGTIEPEAPASSGGFPFFGPPPPAATPDPAGQPVAAGAPDLESGRLAFRSVCSACHGTDGTGGHGGVSLVAIRDSDTVVATILQGKNEMPSLAAAFTPEELRDVAAYVTRVIAR